jgi:tetratricopeptide (TPR) repeat protein
MLIASGAGAVIVLVLLVWGGAHLLSRSPSPSPPPSPSPVAVAPAKPTPPAPRPAARAARAAIEPPELAASEKPSEEPAETSSPSRSHHRTLGGKKVVLEYDPKPTSPTPPPPSAPVPSGEDPATVARAREAYHRGNVKLFSGDTDGAIALYREALKIYPGYVAGYRGLGLGYEQGGKTQDALQALRTYVRTVPNAHDVPLIKKRIEHLEAKQ